MAPHKRPAQPEEPAPTLPNSRPFDLSKQEIDDLFEEANQWLDGAEITTEAEAEGIKRLMKLTREADARKEDARKEEVAPFDAGRKEVQDRYAPLTKRVELIIGGCRKILTGWNLRLEEAQRRKAEEIRLAAEEASRKAQHVAEVAGSTLETQEIVASAEEDARRLLKNAGRAEANIGKGNRMRSKWRVEITDPKLTIAWFFRAYEHELVDWLAERLTAKAYKAGELPASIPGAKIIETKEAY